MYKISVPVMNDNVTKDTRENVLAELRRFGAERVFLALNTYEMDPERRKSVFKLLAENCRFFQENGVEVGVWTWTFWVQNNKLFRNMRSITGKEITAYMCPTDEKFVEFACDYLKEIVACGADVIMFDDDFRYGFLSDSPACLCEEHIARIREQVGQNLTIDEIREGILSGGKNPVRDAWLKGNGDAFRSFAAKVRQAVDEVNPKVRVGACACMTSWDIDGTDAYELARILAGGTRPFVRLIGAPYWAVNKGWGNLLQDVVELERMESAWTKQGDIEIFAEGDAYPRPRTHCPASYLEGFDTALRASGCTEGILKYGIDYCSDIGYESGYARFHERNQELYQQIDRFFGGKESCGVRVYESMNKVGDMVMTTAVNTEANVQDIFFSKAARTLAFNTVPTVYEGDGICGIVFDENARKLPKEALKNGLILDIAAAEILMERGVDVGIESIGAQAKPSPGCAATNCERFRKDGTRILAIGCSAYDIKLKAGAEVLSDMDMGQEILPISFRYENADGERFLVLNLNTRSTHDNLLKHYARSRQYADQIPWLCGSRLPAYAYGHPSLYMQCKKDDLSMAVGMWNFSADIALEPVVELDREYSEISFISCSGRLEKDKVYLSDIPAYGFAGFEVK